MKLEPIEDLPVSPDLEAKSPDLEEESSELITEPIKRITDPWRTNGPLYGTYVEYLEKKDALTPDISEINRPITPIPEIEPSTYTHTFFIPSKSPELVVDAMTVSSPTRHLPRLMQRTKLPNRKSPCPSFNSDLKQRTMSPTPHRLISPKKTSNKNSANSTVKRTDIVFPSMKYTNSNEKVIRADQPVGTKIVNEYLQSKKVTEIITNPLPGTNNQINYLCGQSMLPNLSKISSPSYHNQVTNEPYFFQNHNNDHFQPIIHSTH